jgi:hypothetical protein
MVNIRAAGEAHQTNAMDRYMKNPLWKNPATATLWALVLGHSVAWAAPIQVESGALQGADAHGLSIYKGVPVRRGACG